MPEPQDQNKNKFSINPIVLIKDFKDLLAMFFATIRGKFKIKMSSLCWALIGILYFVLPLDFIPEAVFNLFGFGDDLLVFVYILNQIRPDIERYREFKLALKEKNNEKDI